MYGSYQQTRVLANGWPVSVRHIEWREPLDGYGQVFGGEASVSLVADSNAPDVLQHINSIVQLQVGEGAPSPYRVVGIQMKAGELESTELHIELDPSQAENDPTDDEQILLTTVLMTVFNRAVGSAVKEILVEKGIITGEKYMEKVWDVVDRRFVELATSIVSDADAREMKAYLLSVRDKAPESVQGGTGPLVGDTEMSDT